MSAAAPTPTAPPFHRSVALPSGHSLHYHEVVDASAAPSGTTVVLIQGSGPTLPCSSRSACRSW